MFWIAEPARFAPPWFHVMSGAAVFGAFFIATDYVTSPNTGNGQIVFGLGIGLLTYTMIEAPHFGWTDARTIGGLAVGEGHALMLQAIEHTEPHLPQDRPRYLMGVGKPADIVGAVARGGGALTPVAAALAKRLDFDGPSKGLAHGNGRVCQVRFDKQPVLRLDYHPYPGTSGESRLHLNIWTEGVHVPLDPRSIWGGRP